MKTLPLLVFSVLLGLAPATAQTGSLRLDGSSTQAVTGTEKPDHDLPILCSQSLPSGPGASWFSGLPSAAPSSDALWNVVKILKDSSQGKTTFGLNFWRMVMLLCSAGILLEFFVICRAVSRGETDPAEGFLKWVLRGAVATTMISIGCGAAPYFLVNCVDFQTQFLLSGDTKSSVARAKTIELTHYYFAALLAQEEQASSILAGVENTGDAASGAALSKQLKKELAEKVGAAVGDKTGQTAYFAGMQAITDWVNLRLNLSTFDTATGKIKDISGVGSYSKNYEAYGQALGAVPGLDLRAAGAPARALKNVLYFSAIEISFAIWSCPIALGIWAALSAWPALFGFQNHLIRGVNFVLGVIVATSLICMFSAASIGVAGGSTGGAGDSYGGHLSSQFTALKSGDVLGLGKNAASGLNGALTNLTSGSFMNWLSGTSWQQIVVNVLILSSFPIAAGLVAGTNILGSKAFEALRNNPGGGPGFGSGGSFGGGVPSGGAGGGGGGVPSKTRAQMMN